MPSSSDNMISMQPPHSPSIDQSTLQQSCSIDAEQHQPSRNPASVPSTNTSPPRQPQYMLHANSNSVPQQQSYHVWNLNQTSIPYFLLALYNKRTSTMLITQQHTQSVCCDPTTQQQAHSASYESHRHRSTTITILLWHSNHSTTTAMLLWTNVSATTRITFAYGYNTQQQKYSYRGQSNYYQRQRSSYVPKHYCLDDY